VPLSPAVIEELTALPRTGTYVFSSTRGERPISGYSKIKARAEKLAGFDDWRIHDLRRTAGTGMARAGTAVSTISRVLNHKEGGVTKIYNRYSYLDEKRHALETWARKVGSLVRPGADNVVPLRAESASSSRVRLTTGQLNCRQGMAGCR
jgi:integrase